MEHTADYAPVAQWIRAFVFGTKGRTFESYRVYHENSLSLRWVIFMAARLRGLHSKG